MIEFTLWDMLLVIFAFVALAPWLAVGLFATVEGYSLYCRKVYDLFGMDNP